MALHWSIRALGLLQLASILSSGQQQTGVGKDWPVYGGDAGGSKNSSLKQINRKNVANLKSVWTFATGEPVTPLPNHGKEPAFEPTPLVIRGVMYFSTPYGKVFALDAATGEQKWVFDSHINQDADYGDFASRGVTYWLDAKSSKQPCRERLFFASIDARLIALDAATGKPCETFGKAGVHRSHARPGPQTRIQRRIRGDLPARCY